MKYIVLTFLLISFSLLLKAQVPETIASDRPGNAFTSTVVGKGVFQGQSGIEFGHSKLSSVILNQFTLRSSEVKVDRISQTSAFTNYLRIGSGESNEINLAFDYRYNESFSVSSVSSGNRYFGNYLSGLSKLSLGFRQNLLKEKGNIPAIGVLLNANFNGLLNDYRFSNPDGFLMVIAQKQLSNIFSFTTNLGINYGDFLNNGDIVNSYLYTMNLGYSITPKLSGYIEGYGFIADGEIADYYDAGFGYLLNKDIQIDLYGGIYAEENYFEYFVTAGVSFRIGSN